MKKRLILLLLLVFPCSAFCQSDFKVALLLTGPVTDGGWNASAYEGLKLIEKELNAKVSHIETRNPLEFEEGFREFAKLDYDLVIGHGFEFQDAALKMGRRFPETVFIVSAGNKTNGKNVSPMSFDLGQGAYLLGLMAASISQTGTVGMIGGMALPPVKDAFNGFKKGYLEMSPSGKVLEAYLGSWEDVNGAKEAALAQINHGADVIIHNADAAGLGVVQAAKEKDIYVFGTNKDQNALAPEVIMASAVCAIPEIMLKIAKDVQQKKFKPHPLPYGLKEKGVWLAVSPAIENLIPEQVLSEIEIKKEQMIAGDQKN